jgi:hypothetical protein
MNLNIDVLVLIMDHVNPSDLSSVCRVDSGFYQLASNILYRQICSLDVMCVCYTLLLRPNLAAKVRHFEIPQSRLARPFQRSCSELSTIAQALRSMTGLRILHILDTSMPSWVLNDCSFRVAIFSFVSDCDTDLMRSWNFRNKSWISRSVGRCTTTSED